MTQNQKYYAIASYGIDVVHLRHGNGHQPPDKAQSLARRPPLKPCSATTHRRHLPHCCCSRTSPDSSIALVGSTVKAASLVRLLCLEAALATAASVDAAAGFTAHEDGGRCTSRCFCEPAARSDDDACSGTAGDAVGSGCCGARGADPRGARHDVPHGASAGPSCLAATTGSSSGGDVWARRASSSLGVCSARPHSPTALDCCYSGIRRLSCRHYCCFAEIGCSMESAVECHPRRSRLDG